MRVLPLLLSISCRTSPDPIDVQSLPTLVAFERAATAAGFVVGHGAMAPASPDLCCEAVVDCLAIDAADHLGVLALPPAPSQSGIDFDSYWMWGSIDPGLSRDVRLRPDEAIVWIGPPPPAALYSAFLLQISTRAAADGSRYRIGGATAPPLDLTHSGEHEQIAVILTPDRAMDDRLRRLLFEAGIELAAVYTVPFSSTLADLGLGQNADSFVSMLRVLDPEEPETLSDWWQSPDISVMRITPRGLALPSQPTGYQPALARGTGIDESSYEPALEMLGGALYAHFTGWLPAPGPISAVVRNPTGCLSTFDCDDLWPTRSRSESIPLLLDEGAALLVFGVDHTRTGKASASNISVVTVRSDTGTAIIDHHQLAGSAVPFLPDYPDADDLYAVVFARDCTLVSGLPCVPISTTCPGPRFDQEMYLQFDDWLEPLTGTAPLPSELSLPRAFKLVPLF